MGDQALELWRPCKRQRGQCSSSFAATDMDYDVFLNHRGPDVKVGFIAHLDEALRTAGLNPFLDKTFLKKGDPASRSINDALKVAKVHVAVVSRGYAESKYCLSELVAMMRSGKPVIPVFYDVEAADLRWVENGPFAGAFEKHKSKRTPEQVAEWRDALGQLAEITGFCFRLSDYRGNEAELKREVVNVILSLISKVEILPVDRHLVGVRDHINACIRKLEMMSGSACLLGLVGMGGIGKTSIAKEIYNHFAGCKKFQAMSYLEMNCNSPSSIEVGSSLLKRLQKQLLWDLLHVPENNQQSYGYWFRKLSSQGPVLVVLDDMHGMSQFNELILDTSLLAPGSCIIATSRDRHLLKVVGGEFNSLYLHEVTLLESDDSQKLFNLHAFRCEEAPLKFKTLASDVNKACGGLPLALKVVGSSLFDKRSEEDMEYIWREAVDALKGDVNVMNALRWSYECLSKGEKLMFLDIACIFCGWRKEEAMEIWESCKKCVCCGYGTPHTSLRKLIDKSMISFESTFKNKGDILSMHGLLQDLAKDIGMDDGSHIWGGEAVNVVEFNNQGPKKVRALNHANSEEFTFDFENFAKMTNLHFLILDGCIVSGDFLSISKRLRCLRWRDMPLIHLPPMLNLSNLLSLDFSYSTKLASIWIDSYPTLEACPNLLRLNLQHCTSITTLPDSIGRLSRLQKLDLFNCKNLQKLPTSIGQLTRLEQLHLHGCKSLEALPDSISALSGLHLLAMLSCSSMSKLPPTIGLLRGLNYLVIDLATEWQADAVGQLHALQGLAVTRCTDKAITALDRWGSLSNLHQLSLFQFCLSQAMTKLPETIGLLTNLDIFELFDCKEVRVIPNSMGQLKMLRVLRLRRCSSLETLPDCLGALTSLEVLWIVQCTSITELPASIGHLSRLRMLLIDRCGELQTLPDSFAQLSALQCLEILDCGSLEGLGVSRVLQGLRIWGCTSITELPGSCLMVLDGNFQDPASYLHDDCIKLKPVVQNLKELGVIEATDCGFLRLVHDAQNGRLILQRVHNITCSWSSMV